MAAVGTGGVAVAAAPGVAHVPDAGPAPVPVSAPDTPAFDFFADDPSAHSAPAAPRAADHAGTRDGTTAAGHPEPEEHPEPAGRPDPTDPGEALRARILGQATTQRDAAAQAEREAAERAAAKEAAARKVREQAAAAKAAAVEKAKADAAAAAEAEAERLARLARSYIKPLASYTLTAGYGEADPWANLHTGQDFNAPTGTPVHAVHTGTVRSAGWAGAYGYRVVLGLDDGTELWYCHLSTMVVNSGQVTTGDTIGRVGATGNVTAPHLHLEVRPGGGDPIDPLPWLRTHDVAV
jgi:murein DD-endopeptidase MepM/ murein hydrolase activator NlpD